MFQLKSDMKFYCRYLWYSSSLLSPGTAYFLRKFSLRDKQARIWFGLRCVDQIPWSRTKKIGSFICTLFFLARGKHISWYSDLYLTDRYGFKIVESFNTSYYPLKELSISRQKRTVLILYIYLAVHLSAERTYLRDNPRPITEGFTDAVLLHTSSNNFHLISAESDCPTVVAISSRAVISASLSKVA